MRFLLIGLMVFTMIGCAANVHWVKPGITESEARRDNYQCTKEATYSGTWGVPHKGGTLMGTRLYVDGGLYGLCMQSKGYSPSKD